MVLKSESGKISIRLGPLWYLEHQDVWLKEGDKLTVTGSRITDKGKSVLIAETIKSGGKEYRFRDHSGHPYWDIRM